MALFNSPPRSSAVNFSSTPRKAANVFPVPVGEAMSTFSPRAMSGQAAFCAGVGSPYFFANHWKGLKGRNQDLGLRSAKGRWRVVWDDRPETAGALADCELGVSKSLSALRRI